MASLWTNFSYCGIAVWVAAEAGTMMFGDSINFREASELLDFAYSCGVNAFDSAEMYPVPQSENLQGRSEVFLGKWMAAKPRYACSLYLDWDSAGTRSIHILSDCMSSGTAWLWAQKFVDPLVKWSGSEGDPHRWTRRTSLTQSIRAWFVWELITLISCICIGQIGNCTTAPAKTSWLSCEDYLLPIVCHEQPHLWF